MIKIKTKFCKKCGIEKELDEFEKSKNCNDGRSGTCKICRKEKRQKERECKECGKIFLTAEKDQKFCGYDCFGKSRKNSIKCNCDYCDKEIEVKKCLYETYTFHYCNMECKAKHLKKIMLGDNNPNYNSVEYTCDGCNKKIMVENNRIKNQKHIFCSKECFKNNIGKFYTGESNSNHTPYINKKCLQCGELIKKKPFQYKNEKCFCSSQCANIYNSQFRKRENSPRWKRNLTDEDRVSRRGNVYYLEWRKKVYEKFNFTCALCGSTKSHNFNAHHLNSWNKFRDERYDVENGILLCKVCHKKYHGDCGYGDNTKEQFEEWMINL